MFYIGGVGLALFLSLLLINKRNKTLADKILFTWLFLISIHLLLFYFLRMNLYPTLLGASFPFPLIHGPFLYLYTVALTKPNQINRYSLLHFIPFTAVIVYLIPFLSLPAEQKLYVFEHHGEGYEIFSLIVKIAIIASGVGYIVLTSWVLRNHRISITNHFSNTEKINLRWLQYLIYWISMIWIMVIVANDDWIYAFAVLFVFFIGVFGIQQIGIFNSTMSPATTSSVNIAHESLVSENEVDEESTPVVNDRKKYLKSGLSNSASKVLHERLTQLMNSSQLYTKSDLSLTDLARQLNTQTNHLSQVINELEGKNFYDYINSLRIEEFKRLAASAESRKYTLLALAQHCGFTSKSSFNRYFRKVTGLSPSEFIQGVEISN